ncbi:MAG: ribonuclease P [Candidatus Aenigmarchaeota archaeon]|nr:ribonuclease P [Candidatus Aenigmarchaeota archaeon]
MVKSKSIKPSGWQRLAKERISILFEQAEKEFRKHPERSKRYVELARRIGMRYNVRIPKNLRRRFCKKCLSYLKPGVNCRVRMRKDRQAVVVTCSVCGNVSRHPYIKEKQNIKQ